MKTDLGLRKTEIETKAEEELSAANLRSPPPPTPPENPAKQYSIGSPSPRGVGMCCSADIVVYHPAKSLSLLKEIGDTKIILLDHIRHSTPGRRLKPYFILSPSMGSIATCVISDTGFLTR